MPLLSELIMRGIEEAFDNCFCFLGLEEAQEAFVDDVVRPRTIILIVSGQSTSFEETQKEANSIKLKGIGIRVIAVDGSPSSTFRSEVNRIASSNADDNSWYLNSYSDLSSAVYVDNVLSSICSAVADSKYQKSYSAETLTCKIQHENHKLLCHFCFSRSKIIFIIVDGYCNSPNDQMTCLTVGTKRGEHCESK